MPARRDFLSHALALLNLLVSGCKTLGLPADFDDGRDRRELFKTLTDGKNLSATLIRLDGSGVAELVLVDPTSQDQTSISEQILQLCSI